MLPVSKCVGSPLTEGSSAQETELALLTNAEIRYITQQFAHRNCALVFILSKNLYHDLLANVKKLTMQPAAFTYFKHKHLSYIKGNPSSMYRLTEPVYRLQEATQCCILPLALTMWDKGDVCLR